jgi:endonuclease VIII
MLGLCRHLKALRVMPEGDTIFRTTASIRKWIGGREITAAATSLRGVDIQQVVGRVLSRVEPIGKHVLMQFDSADDDHMKQPLLLRTHMMMSGSWHVYADGAAWQRPARQAKLVLHAAERLAVCFNAPVVELTRESIESSVGVAHLGPDILHDHFDVSAVITRVRRGAADRAIGEVLLDQRVVAGIGNIYRCESLFLERIHPWTSHGSLSSEALVALMRRAEQLMKQNLDPAQAARNLNAGVDATWVYRRAPKPCRRCGTEIESRPQGPQARTAYWCPGCQPPPRSWVRSRS